MSNLREKISKLYMRGRHGEFVSFLNEIIYLSAINDVLGLPELKSAVEDAEKYKALIPEMTRDQFLVEQEGGDTTQQYGCYSDYSYEAMPCVIDTDERHNCVFAGKGIEKTQCKNWVAVPVLTPDFSEWENFGRLLELAENKGVEIRVETASEHPKRWDIQVGNFHKPNNTLHDTADVLATLTAYELGWKEAKT